MPLYRVDVSNTEIGARRGYIYAVVLPVYRVLYIGQTRNALGALGRLAQHLSYSGSATLRQRIARHLGGHAVDLGDACSIAYSLADRTEFSGDSGVYREAVEAVTQATILNALGDTGVRLVVLSYVERNGYVGQDLVVEAGVEAAAGILRWLERLQGEGRI